MLNCKEASRLVSEKHERRLRFRERLGLRLHLLMCVSCSRFDAQIRFIGKALRILNRRAKTDAVGSGMPHEVHERISRALAERDKAL